MFDMLKYPASNDGTTIDDDSSLGEKGVDDLLASLTGLYLQSEGSGWAEKSKKRCRYIEALTAIVERGEGDTMDAIGSVIVCMTSFVSDFKKYISLRESGNDNRFTRLWKPQNTEVHDSLLLEGGILSSLVQKLVSRMSDACACFSALGNDLDMFVDLLDSSMPFWARCHSIESISHIASMDNASVCSLLLRCPSFAMRLLELLSCTEHQVLLRDTSARLVSTLLNVNKSDPELTIDENVCIMQEVLSFEGCVEALLTIARQENGLCADDTDTVYTDISLCVDGETFRSSASRGSLGVVLGCVLAVEALLYRNNKVLKYFVDSKLIDQLKCFIDTEHVTERLGSTWSAACGQIQLSLDGGVKCPTIPFSRRVGFQQSGQQLTHEKILRCGVQLMCTILESTPTLNCVWVSQVASKWLCTFASIVWCQETNDDSGLVLCGDDSFFTCLLKICRVLGSSRSASSFFGTHTFSSNTSWFILLGELPEVLRDDVLATVGEGPSFDEIVSVVEKGRVKWFCTIGTYLAEKFDANEGNKRLVLGLCQPRVLSNLIEAVNENPPVDELSRIVACFVLLTYRISEPSWSLPNFSCAFDNLGKNAQSLFVVATMALSSFRRQHSELVSHPTSLKDIEENLSTLTWFHLLHTFLSSDYISSDSFQGRSLDDLLESFSGNVVSFAALENALKCQDESRRSCLHMAFSLTSK